MVVDGEDPRPEAPSLIVRFDMEADATELGGLRVPSVMTENLDSFQGAFLRGEPKEPLDDTLILLSLLYALVVEYRCLTDSGTPSHFELTLGTEFGSFWPT